MRLRQLRPVKWLLANQFQHVRSLLGPSLYHESVPATLRSRIEMRLVTGKRLLLVRAILTVILFLGVGTVLGVLGAFTFSAPVELALRIVAALIPIVAAPAILVVTRALRLLETDVQVLASEVVARCQAAGGPLPSGFHVRLTKRKGLS